MGSSNFVPLRSRPMCAVCAAKVESMTEEDCPFTETVRFTARCHGDTQSVLFTYAEIARGGLDFGTAFQPDRRLAP